MTLGHCNVSSENTWPCIESILGPAVQNFGGARPLVGSLITLSNLLGPFGTHIGDLRIKARPLCLGIRLAAWGICPAARLLQRSYLAPLQHLAPLHGAVYVHK